MPSTKKSFVLYIDQKEVVEQLSDEEAGKIFKHIYRYIDSITNNTKFDNELNGLLKIIFTQFKILLDKDHSKWLEIKEKRSKAGKASANKRQHMLTHVNTCQQKATHSTVNVNVNDNVNVNGNVNVNDKNKKDKYLNIRKEIISYLNSKLGTKFNHNSNISVKHINARLNEGYSLEDFKLVINYKIYEWKGTEYEKYLTPKTLFSNKFETYLNQAIIAKKTIKKSNGNNGYHIATGAGI